MQIHQIQQESIWRTAKGEEIPLSQLTEGHLNNCLALLERHARSRLRILGKDEDSWQKVVDDKFWELRAEAARRTAQLQIPKNPKSFWSRFKFWKK